VLAFFSQEKPKSSEEKKMNEVDDLFADTGSIFEDLPKKSKEKKKKKATTSKEESIFDDTKGTVQNVYQFLVYRMSNSYVLCQRSTHDSLRNPTV
jgi:ElaB/YqjD/DUF883 family membrane-anchored ribosome-binding protein